MLYIYISCFHYLFKSSWYKHCSIEFLILRFFSRNRVDRSFSRSVTSVSVRMVAVSSKTNEASSAVFRTWKKNVTLFSGKPMWKSFRWLVVHKFRTLIGQQNEHIDDQRLNLEEDSTCLASFASRSTVLLGFRSLLFFCSQISFVLFLFWEALMLRTMLWTYNRSLHTRVLSFLLVLEQCEIFLWHIVKVETKWIKKLGNFNIFAIFNI